MSNSPHLVSTFRPKSWLLMLGLFSFSAALATAMIGEGFAEVPIASVGAVHRAGTVAGASVVTDAPVVLRVIGVGDFRVVTNQTVSPYQLVQLAEQRAGLRVGWRNTESGQAPSSFGGVSAEAGEQWQVSVDGTPVALDDRLVQPGMTVQITTTPQ